MQTKPRTTTRQQTKPAANLHVLDVDAEPLKLLDRPHAAQIVVLLSGSQQVASEERH